MAACMVGRARQTSAYFISLSAEMKAVSHHGSVVMMRQNNKAFSSRMYYGTRGTDDTEDVQIHIPVERLTVAYSRSSGPGGQHVNKVNTKAEVRFHLHTAHWIPEDVRQNILEKNKNRINKAGELLVTSERSRSQQRNLADCIQKITAIIRESRKKPCPATAQDIALRAARLEKRNKERLKQKKIHSAIKYDRRVNFD
ncbi:peptidyl-tRNA hydrolase ICT1, mitochondrial [Nematolebias whitei]|uniref:peptidyl-tRNA hydrolase ICT1, mitochondrial n=1 Tax=Nematolebias whitei TaxID=451745 RepID=UPI0018995B77|nr:peptidyl-tRNA hydrolase ICT1, mitochondrial [Nematolebias whitei]